MLFEEITQRTTNRQRSIIVLVHALKMPHFLWRIISKFVPFSLPFGEQLGFFVRFDILMSYLYLFDLQKPLVKRIAVPKPKKVAGKSKVIEVIEISSDSDEELGIVAVREKKATKKKATTYTSVLTARSKVHFTCEMMILDVK